MIAGPFFPLPSQKKTEKEVFFVGQPTHPTAGTHTEKGKKEGRMEGRTINMELSVKEGGGGGEMETGKWV